MERRNLLVSDLDNTLLGDDAALAEFATWYETIRHELRLVYNSGRFPDSVLQSVRNTALPPPDAIIGGVGTEICFPIDGHRLDAWPQHRERWNAAAIHANLGAHKQLEPQPTELQSDFKVSYYGVDLSTEFLRQLKCHLTSSGFQVEIVYSSNRDLDVLPSDVNKGSAASFLAQHWGLDRENVVVCGDSGNDLAMFRQGFWGITVANAHREIRQLNGERIYHSPEHYAAGVLDGVRRWRGRTTNRQFFAGPTHCATPDPDANHGTP